jgi:ankyrin repeat protein
LAQGANTEETGVVCTSTKGNTVISNILGAAASFGRVDIMNKIIGKMNHAIELKAVEKHEFRKNFKKECTDFTPLMLAVAGEFPYCLDCAKILVENGANTNQVDFEGSTILHIAARR